MDEYLRMSRGSMMSMMSSEKSSEIDEYLRMRPGPSAVPSAVPTVAARGFFDVAPTRNTKSFAILGNPVERDAKSFAILGNPVEHDAKSYAGTLIATDDLPCMLVLITAP